MSRTVIIVAVIILLSNVLIAQVDTSNVMNTSEVEKDPNECRMIIFPTALPIQTLEGYIQLNQLVLPFAAIGIENFLVIGGGISPVPGFNHFYYLSPKITPVHFSNLYLACGLFMVSSTTEPITLNGFPTGFGIAYGLATYNSKNFSITVGIGKELRESYVNGTPFIIIGGDLNMEKKVKLIIEIWRLPNAEYYFNLIGLRFIGTHFSADLALLNFFLSRKNYIPWLTFTYNFDLLNR